MNIFKHLVAVGIFATFTMSNAVETCTPIDAVTMSTLKVATTSKVCETTAIVDFTSSKTNGTRTFAYGTSTSYGKNVTLTMASTKRGTINLTGLTAATKYYYKVDNEYEGRNVYTLTGTFTTNPSGGTTQPPVITSAKTVSCAKGDSVTYTATATDPANKAVTFTFSGQPSWITVNGANLKIKPITTSTNVTVKIIASNGTAYDTIDLAVSVLPTSIKLTDMIRKTALGIGVGNENIEISLFSLNGALVYKKVMAPKTDIQVSKALSEMKNSGTYMCSIKSGSNEVRQLLTLQK